jgi:hypothetical protein
MNMWYRMVERIEIVINRSWLGKKYVVRVYDKEWLLESCPYDRLEDIKIKWFRLVEMKWSYIVKQINTSYIMEIC